MKKIVILLLLASACKKRAPAATEVWNGADPTKVDCSWQLNCDVRAHQCGGASSTATCVGGGRAYLCVRKAHYNSEDELDEWRVSCAAVTPQLAPEKP